MIAMEYVCRVASLDEIVSLRAAVIIRGTGRPNEFPEDRRDSTLHFGAFLDAQNVGCASFMLNEWFGEPAYQLRGMAIAELQRGHGIGGALLRFSEAHIAVHTQVRQLWCNARTSAITFYQAADWSVASEEFDVGQVGPHRRMCKRLCKS